MAQVKGLILAGGLGTRMKDVITAAPKVLLPIGGKPVLQLLVEHLARHHITDIGISLYWDSDVIRNHMGNGGRFGVRFTYIVEREARGSGGALYEASRFLDRTAVVVNGDIVTTVDISKLIEWHRSKGGIATIVVHPTDHPHDSDMIEVNEEGRVLRIARGDSVSDVANAGMFVFEQAIIEFAKDQKESLEQKLLPRVVAAGKPVYAYYTEEYIKDMGTPERYREVMQDFA